MKPLERVNEWKKGAFGLGGRAGQRREAGSQAQVPASDELLTLVEFWEDAQPEILEHRLVIPQCPKDSYGGAFKDIHGAYRTVPPRPGQRFVFFGSIEHFECSEAGVSIRFSDRTSYRLPVDAWIPTTLAPQSRLRDFIATFERMEGKYLGKFYVLAQSKHDRPGKRFVLSPASLKHVAWSDAARLTQRIGEL